MRGPRSRCMFHPDQRHVVKFLLGCGLHPTMSVCNTLSLQNTLVGAFQLEANSLKQIVINVCWPPTTHVGKCAYK